MRKVDVQVDPSLLKELVVGNKKFRSSIDYRVTERDLEKARKELNETEVKRRTCLEELKTMLSKDERMRYRTDDDYLLRFLRYRKFDVKETYNSIHRFYTLRNEDPALFTLTPDYEWDYSEKMLNMMPYTNDNGELVFFHRLGSWNPSEISLRDYCRMVAIGSDVISMNPHAQIDGAIAMFDLRGISLSHLTALQHPPSIRMWTQFIQDLYPWRAKKVIVFNLSALFYAAFYFVRSFLKRKIAERIVLIRSDFKEIHKHINPEILPREYGGNLDDEECRLFEKNVILSNREYLKYEHSFIGYKE